MQLCQYGGSHQAVGRKVEVWNIGIGLIAQIYFKCFIARVNDPVFLHTEGQVNFSFCIPVTESVRR